MAIFAMEGLRPTQELEALSDIGPEDPIRFVGVLRANKNHGDCVHTSTGFGERCA